MSFEFVDTIHPTLEEVEKADRIQLARWYRFLPSSILDEEIDIDNRSYERFHEMGGFTPEISKQIGWEKP